MNDGQIDNLLANAPDQMPPGLAAKIRAQIQANTEPVRPLMSDTRHTALLLAVFGLVGLACAAIEGFYGWRALSNTELFSFLLGLVGLACAAGIFTARSMRPAAGNLRAWLLIGISLVIYEALILTQFRDYSSEGFLRRGLACLILGLTCGLVAAIPTWLLVRRGFIVEPVKSGALVGLVAGLSGWLGLTLHCPILSTPHTGVWHAAVVPVCALVGATAGAVSRFR